MSLHLYNSLIIPHADYSDIIYDVMSASDANTLQVVQNKCLGICLRAEPRTSIAELHVQAKLSYLSTRRQAHSCNFVYKGLNNQSSKNVNNLFISMNEAHNRDTRASRGATVRPPAVSKLISKGNIAYRGSVYFNDLPASVRTAPSYNSFKGRVKKHLF